MQPQLLPSIHRRPPRIERTAARPQPHGKPLQPIQPPDKPTGGGRTPLLRQNRPRRVSSNPLTKTHPPPRQPEQRNPAPPIHVQRPPPPRRPLTNRALLDPTRLRRQNESGRVVNNRVQ